MPAITNIVTQTKQASRVVRDTYIWNTAAGLLMAFESVIILMVLMRATDVTTAGIFTIAYANANLFLNMGKFGMRNFQVSDVQKNFAFETYVRSRIITVAAMLFCGFLYLTICSKSIGYSADKFWIIIIMLFFKGIDAVEDICIGNCQQNERLDVAAKALTFRLVSTIAMLCIGTAFANTLLIPLLASTIYTGLFVVGEIFWMRKRYSLPSAGPTNAQGTLAQLIKECFPLFTAAFLLFFIGQAPKFAIDGIMTDADQAYYGFIAMPVFIVSLLASFIYNPIVASLAQNWVNGEVDTFIQRFAKQILYVTIITVICDAGAFVIGIPVLGWLYNTDLHSYLWDLIILVTGGGFLALANLFTIAITIMRKQRLLLPAYLVVSILAAGGSALAVKIAGIDGASWIYLALMIILAIWFAILVGWEIRNRNKHSN